jgi:UDP-N-acetylmuramoyl-tripeptide--D-alanyl-D-alanine ligase
MVNVYNALAAIAVARFFGLDYNIIARRLAAFPLPKSRLSFVHKGGINFIDDTYNSNPQSLSQALDALDKLGVRGRKIFIMGDMLELGKRKNALHSMAGVEIARVCDILIAVGRLARLAAQKALQSGLNARSVFHCVSAAQAKSILYKQVSPSSEDIILLKGSRLMRLEEVL